MDGAYVVCSGWLRKAPREDKCGPVIWRRRWFVLRSGKMSGDPDVLQYYRSPGSQRPLRTIDLTFCQWVDAEVNFHTLRQPDGFVFAIETARRPFYLLADTEEAMYKWVDGICRLRGFVEIDQSTGRPLMQSPDGRASLEQPGAGSPGVTAGTLACSSAQDQGHGPSVDVGDAKKPGQCWGPPLDAPHAALGPEPALSLVDDSHVYLDFQSCFPSGDLKDPSNSLCCDSHEPHYMPMDPEYVPMDPRGVPGYQNLQPSVEEWQVAILESPDPVLNPTSPPVTPPDSACARAPAGEFSGPAGLATVGGLVVGQP